MGLLVGERRHLRAEMAPALPGPAPTEGRDDGAGRLERRGVEVRWPTQA